MNQPVSTVSEPVFAVNALNQPVSTASEPAVFTMNHFVSSIVSGILSSAPSGRPFGSNVALSGSNVTTSDHRYEGPPSGNMSSNSVDSRTTDGKQLIQSTTPLLPLSTNPPVNSDLEVRAVSHSISPLPLSTNSPVNSDLETRAVSHSTSPSTPTPTLFPWGNIIPDALWVISAIALYWYKCYLTIGNPDPQSDSIIRQSFDRNTVGKLETNIARGLPNVPHKLPYGVFEQLLAHGIATIHAVRTLPQDLPDENMVKAAIKADPNHKTSGEHTKPPVMQSKRAHKKSRKGQKSRTKRSYKDFGNYGDSSSDDESESDKSSRNSECSGSDLEEEQPSQINTIHSHSGPLPAPKKESPLNAILYNTATKRNADQLNEFEDYNMIRDYDSTSGNSRKVVGNIESINSKHDVTNQLRLLRHMHEAKGITLYSFLIALYRGTYIAAPSMFIPPLTEDEDYRLRLKEEINSDPDLKKMPAPNDSEATHQQLVKKLLYIYARLFNAGSSEMYVARFRCGQVAIKDPKRPVPPLLELGRLYDLCGYNDDNFQVYADNVQRMLLSYDAAQHLKGISSNLTQEFRTTAKDVYATSIEKGDQLNTRQLIYFTFVAMQTAQAGDQLLTDAEQQINSGVTTKKTTYTQPINTIFRRDRNRNRPSSNIRSNSGALNDDMDGNPDLLFEGDQDHGFGNNLFTGEQNNLFSHMASLNFHDPERFHSNYGEQSMNAQEVQQLMTHTAKVAKEWEREQIDWDRNEAARRSIEQGKKEEEKRKAAQDEQQRLNLLIQAKEDAAKLLAETRATIQQNLLTHQAHITNQTYEEHEQPYVFNHSGPFVEHPTYHHLNTNAVYSYGDPSFPPSGPPTVYGNAGASLYKQQAYSTIRGARPSYVNPAQQSMPKGYPPPPPPANSGPPTPTNHCNICGLHNQECEAIGSRYTDPHTNISHCFLRDKTTGNFTLDFRALDQLKLAQLSTEKRDRVIAASVKYGVLNGIPPHTLEYYRDRFKLLYPPPMTQDRFNVEHPAAPPSGPSTTA